MHGYVTDIYKNLAVSSRLSPDNDQNKTFLRLRIASAVILALLVLPVAAMPVSVIGNHFTLLDFDDVEANGSLWDTGAAHTNGCATQSEVSSCRMVTFFNQFQNSDDECLRRCRGGCLSWG